MTIEEKITLLDNLLEIEEKNDIGNLTSSDRAEFQMWLKGALEQEPKVGKWIYHEKSISTGFRDYRECSCCNCYFRWEMPRNSYCPNCGARMSEVENDMTDMGRYDHYTDSFIQESKTGRWIADGEMWKCSKCEELSCCRGKYCPDCGAKMESEE